jgi:hypothetical protein
MHKGVILLIKSSQIDEAKDKVQEFMVQYGEGDIWDWYVIGGRWSGTLNSKSKEFFEKSEAHFKATYSENNPYFISTKMVEEQADMLNAIWTEIGGEGLNPHTRNSYNDFGYDDDVVALSECKDVVIEWKKDIEAEAEITWNKMLEAKKKEGYDMSSYYAKRYAEMKYDEFCFDSNVYDTELQTNDPTQALENANEYFAVMIDMHN